MREVFVDTSHLIATLLPGDSHHARAKQAAKELARVRWVLTDGVLVEFLNYVCGMGGWVRARAAQWVEAMLANPDIVVVPTAAWFTEALARYRRRLDKEWSLTDCGSMYVMEIRHISNALTSDEHFRQAGFRALLLEE